MAANQISVTISAVDKISEKLEAINKRVEKFMQPARRMQASMKRLSDASGLTRLQSRMRKLGNAAKNTFKHVAHIIEPLAVITSAASLAGLYKLTTSWAQLNFQISTSAQNMGVTTSQLMDMEGASRLAGSGSQALASGMNTLGTNLWNAIGGRSPETVATLQRLGYSFSDIDKMSKNLTGTLPQLANKIAAIKTPWGQAAVATALFGSAGYQMLPFLRLGAKGIEEYEQKAKSYGLFNQKGAAAANQLRMAQVGLSMAVDGLGYSIAQSLSPYLTPMLNQLGNWIAKNRQWIATGITEHIKEFVAGVKKVWPEVDHVVKSLGGWKDLLLGLGGIMGAVWLTAMLAPIVTITTSILGLIASIDRANTAAGALATRSAAVSTAVTAAADTAAVSATAAAATGGASLAAGVTAGEAAAGASTLGVLTRLPVLGPLVWWATHGSGDTANNAQANPATGKSNNQEGFNYWQKAVSAHPAALPSGNALKVLNEGMGYFMGQGWTKQQAAGIMANAQRESSLDPNSVNTEGGTDHRGLFQWDSSRWAELVKMFGPRPTAEQQMQFAQWELTKSSDFQGVGANLKAATNEYAAAGIFNQGYEKSGDTWQGIQDRMANAYAYASAPFVPMPAAATQPPAQPAPPLAATQPPAQPAPPPAATQTPAQPAPPPAAIQPPAPPYSPAPILPTPSGPPVIIGNGEGFPTASALNGNVNVNITHNNAPAGTTMTATSDIPGVKVSSLRIRKSMAGGGL